MIDGVHGDAGIMRVAAKPAITTGLSDRDVHVVRVRYRANRAGAAAVDQALLARIQADNYVILVAADELGIGAGGTRELAALSDLQFHIMNESEEHTSELQSPCNLV